MDAESVRDIKKRVLRDVDPSEIKKKRRERVRAILLTAGEFLGLTALVFLCFWALFGMSTVSGYSMFPTLRDGERVVYSRVGSTFRPGDVIAMEYDGSKDFVKRVVAVAGDTVNLSGGELYVNGALIRTDGAQGQTNPVNPDIHYPLTVPDKSVFVLGDNRENSEDSRSFGPVALKSIKGRLCLYVGIINNGG